MNERAVDSVCSQIDSTLLKDLQQEFKVFDDDKSSVFKRVPSWSCFKKENGLNDLISVIH